MSRQHLLRSGLLAFPAITLALPLCFASILRGEPPAPLPPPGEMARSKALIDAGRYQEARARLEPIVADHPRWARALGLLGLTFYKENRFEAARPLFERALEADPQEIAVRPVLGWTLLALGEIEEARRMFDALLAQKPGYAPAHYALGIVHLERDDAAAARRHLETAVRLAAKQGDREQEGRAHARLGDLFVRLDDLPAAKRELELALELFPDEREARFKLGRVQERLSRPATDRSAASAPSAAADRGSLRFTAMTGSAGLDLVMTSGTMPSREILEVDGGGIALFDYDGDGDLDVFLANGATLAQPERGPGSRLYANRGDGTFEDVTGRTSIDLHRWAMGVAVGDYDGDGWDDLYVSCYGANALLHNEASDDGGRRFRDVAAAAGVADARWSTSAAFGDLDTDGDLDLFVVNYLDFDTAHPPSRTGKEFKGVPVMAGPRGLPAQADVLYENLGNSRFRDVSAAAGIVSANGEAASREDFGLGVRIADFDEDGKPDIFVGNDSTADQLFRNLGGLRFEDIAPSAGVAANGQGTTQATMGIGLSDADGNGAPDLFLTVFSDDTNTLHLNLGGGLFDDGSARLGLAAASRPYLGWGCGFYDFDLDGDEDLFIANGHVYPEMEDPRVGGSWAQSPLLFERRGPRFEVAACSGAWCSERYHGRATAFGDLDGDLDVEVLMTTLNGPVLVLRNEAEGNGLAVRLEGTGGNRLAYGSMLELATPAGTQRRWLTGGGSFQSVDAAEVTFGLGEIEANSKLRLRVRWPDGRVRVIENLPTDRRVRLRQTPLL